MFNQMNDSDLDSYEEIEVEEEYFTEDDTKIEENISVKDEHFNGVGEISDAGEISDTDDQYEGAGELTPAGPQYEVNSPAAAAHAHTDDQSPALIDTDCQYESPAPAFSIPFLFSSPASFSRPNYGNLPARVRLLERKLFEINLTKTS